jgi:hypothetical protein
MSPSASQKNFVKQAEAVARDERAIQKRIDKLDEKDASVKTRPMQAGRENTGPLSQTTP